MTEDRAQSVAALAEDQVEALHDDTTDRDRGPDQAPPQEADAPEKAVRARPTGIPEKFWDADAGALRTDALLKSYVELERKLGSMVPLPSDDMDAESNARLRKVLGVPETAEDYEVQAPNEAVRPDPAINARLHEAGFNQRQAQLVYDLAADYVMPLIDTAVGEIEASHNAERLAAHFGGEEVWATLAQQLNTWGEANLAQDVMEVLASSYDGILAMHQMMRAREPSVLRESDGHGEGVDEAELTALMRDPRYWRDRDPTFVAQVTEGFEQLYPN